MMATIVRRRRAARASDETRWVVEGRSPVIDSLRGLAVLLMVLDHGLVAAGVAGHPLRQTVTRASLPLFCVVAGALLPTTPRWARLGAVAAAGLVATVLGGPIGIGQPDVLLILVAVLAAAPFLVFRGGWAVALGLAVIQPVTWPVPWSGYQPGTVLALVLLGVMVGRPALERLPWRPVLAAVGRAPLRWYLGHLAVLAGLRASLFLLGESGRVSVRVLIMLALPALAVYRTFGR